MSNSASNGQCQQKVEQNRKQIGMGGAYDRRGSSLRENYRVSSFSLGRCCCCVFSVLFVLAAIVGVIALVVFLVIKPKKPEFELESVRVEALNVEPPPESALSNREVFLSLNIGMVFAATNTNKVGIKYSPTRLYVMYKGMPIGVAVVPAFYQPSHSHTIVETQFVVSRVNILQASALDLLRDATVNDRVPLRITGDVGARIRALEITFPQVQVSLDCQIVLSPRRRALTDKQCGVDGVNF